MLNKIMKCKIKAYNQKFITYNNNCKKESNSIFLKFKI